jgi:hypothetical protein
MNENLIKIIFSNLSRKILSSLDIKNKIYKRCMFSILPRCFHCNSAKDLRKCLCLEIICITCLNLNKNESCHQNCYIFENNGKDKTSDIYNVSKHPLPKNFEAKVIYYDASMIRTGIIFDKSIMDFQEDDNSPNHDIYYLLQDLRQFYTPERNFRDNGRDSDLRPGDELIIKRNNNSIAYYYNNSCILDHLMTHRADDQFYFFIHCRNMTSNSARIVYLVENLPNV